MNKIETVIVSAQSEAYAEVFALREEILRKPLGMSLHNEDLSRDLTDVILAGKIEGRIVCCLMLHHVNNEEVQLRQMAVCNEWQGQGVGRQLVQEAERVAVAKGYKKMILHARDAAKGFYSSMQYRIVGDEFTEVGIPHYHMEKEL